MMPRMGWIGNVADKVWDTWWGWLTGLQFLTTILALLMAATVLYWAFMILMVIPVMVTLWRDKRRGNAAKPPAQPGEG